MAKFETAILVAKAIENTISEIMSMGIRLRNFRVSDEEIQAQAVTLVREMYSLKENKDGSPKSNSVLGRNLVKLEEIQIQVNLLHKQAQEILNQAHQNAHRQKDAKRVQAEEQLAKILVSKAQDEAERIAAGKEVVRKTNERLNRVPAPVVRRVGEIRDAKGQIDLGLIEHKPKFPGLEGKTVARPVMGRPKIGCIKVAPADVDYQDEEDDEMSETEKEIYFTDVAQIIDYCPPSAIIELASLHGTKIGDTIFVDHLVLEIGGTIDDNPWAKRVIDKGIIDRRTGIRWRVVSESGSGMRQGKLFLWPEQNARNSLEILAGRYLEHWLKVKMVPSKAVAYLGLGFSSLIYRIEGKSWAAGAKIRVVSDVEIVHEGVKAIKNGRERIAIEHKEAVTDGVIAVGSAVMRRIEKAIGFPAGTVHAVQIRGGLGSAIKGLLVEYTEIDPELILVFESATKMTKDVKVVAEILTTDCLGITRINRLPDNLTGLTSLSKQVLGLLPKRSMDAVAKARSVAKWTADNITTPSAAKMLLGLLDSEDEEMLLQSAADAAKDGDMKKATLLRNPALALQDRTVRRYVADMLVDKIRRQATFGNLLVNGFDLWQAPEPVVIKAAEEDLIKEPITVAQLKNVAKKLGMSLLSADEVRWAGCPDHLNGRRVALIRHPLQHPAQFATAMMASGAKDDHRWGVIFLPASGLYQATMGGSDFDGDEIKVVSDPDLIEAIEISSEGMGYLIMPPKSDTGKVLIEKKTYEELLRGVLHRAMKAVGQIGILSNLASTASALTENDRQRELLLSVLAFLVMVAVDAVKTGDFPDKYIRKLLTEEDLAGSPLKLDGDSLKVVREKINGRETAKKAVWLGQEFEFRDQLAAMDRTVMAEVFMDMDKLGLIVRGGQKDSNDKRVAAQLMRVARSIMDTPEDLKPIAEQIIDLLPEDEREKSLNRLEQIRKDKNNALWNQKRDEVQSYNKLIQDEKKALTGIMAEPVAQARKLLDMVGKERARALTAVLYSIRPAAAWAFCGPELVDLFGRALDKPSLVIDAPPAAGSIKFMGIEYNGISVQEALRLAVKHGEIEIKPVEFEERGMWVHRGFIGTQCIGQVSAEFEPYAETLSGRFMRINESKTYIEGKTLVVKFEVPTVRNGHELWLERALRRIGSIWIYSALDGIKIALRNEWAAMENVPKEYGLKIKQAFDDQEEAISWVDEILDCQTLDELSEVTQAMRTEAAHLPQRLKEELNAQWWEVKRLISGEVEIPL